MNPDTMNSRPVVRPEKPARLPRKAVLILAVLGGLGAVVLVVAALAYGRRGAAAFDDGRAPKSAGTGRVVSQRVPARVKALRRPSWLSGAKRTDAESSARAGELIKTLSAVNLPAGGLTPARAAEWHRNLEELIEQGRAAVPPLRDFFDKNEDVKFNAIPGASPLGEPTLRIAFIKVLFDIPDPENVNLQTHVLRTTTDPEEIALLARQLEMQEPGTYRSDIIKAAQTVLNKMQNGELPALDTRPLDEVIRKYGTGEGR